MIKRRFHRHRLHVPLFVAVGSGRVYEKAVAIESCDISGGGLRFESPRDFLVDASTKIVMGRLGDLPAAALIEGRVVYRLPVVQADGYNIGVEFLEFINTSRDELLARIRAWHESNK